MAHRLRERSGPQKAAVALANKNARIAADMLDSFGRTFVEQCTPAA